jgi:DNA polymerase III subunit delta
VSVPFDALQGDRVPKWILHHASTELKLELTSAAAERLHALVGEDLRELALELDKLAALSAHRTATGSAAVIDETGVDEVVGVRRGETLGDLLDRVAARDAASALRIVEHVLSQPKASGVTTVMALSAQTLAIGWAIAALADGLPRHRLEQELYALLKAKSPFTGRAWGEAVRAWSRAALSGTWSHDAIDESLDALLTADIALKWSGVSSESQVVSSTILAMCAAGSRRRAA